MIEITRFLSLPKSSFMVLGPRGTGKSTLIKKLITFDLEIDLLISRNFLSLHSDPSKLIAMTKNLKAGSWVLIDEVQKIPALLDEVHYLIESKKINFALSGSSARKLRRHGANLLAGRALSIQLFPMAYVEYKDYFKIEDAIKWGSLPKTINDRHSRSDYLSSYVETYLREELIEEGVLRKLAPFSRFLNVCGLYHAQILNIDHVARESFVPRSTIETYFNILEETLIGFKLNSLQCKFNKKEVKHPKFYMFDNGVSRACANLVNEEVDSVWMGHAFESLIINEVKTFNRYLKKNRDLFYYKYAEGYEIDLIIETRKKTLSQTQQLTAIEIKSSKKWDNRWNNSLLDLKEKSKNKITRLIGIYRGQEIININGLEIYPAEDFLTLLAEGKILG